jgi:hypothetical protein
MEDILTAANEPIALSWVENCFRHEFPPTMADLKYKAFKILRLQNIARSESRRFVDDPLRENWPTHQWVYRFCKRNNLCLTSPRKSVNVCSHKRHLTNANTSAIWQRLEDGSDEDLQDLCEAFEEAATTGVSSYRWWWCYCDSSCRRFCYRGCKC